MIFLPLNPSSRTLPEIDRMVKLEHNRSETEREESEEKTLDPREGMSGS